MAASALIDTGVILALVDRSDRWHKPCVDVYHTVPLPMLTTEAVLAEVFHLTYRNLRDVRGVWTLLGSGAVRLAAIAHDELPEIRTLMRDYADRPMDFADATLVYLAKRESLSVILTVDQADFATYRIEGKRQFRVVPRKRP